MANQSIQNGMFQVWWVKKLFQKISQKLVKDDTCHLFWPLPVHLQMTPPAPDLTRLLLSLCLFFCLSTNIIFKAPVYTVTCDPHIFLKLHFLMLHCISAFFCHRKKFTATNQISYPKKLGFPNIASNTLTDPYNPINFSLHLIFN